jgi:hypothetical protein
MESGVIDGAKISGLPKNSKLIRLGLEKAVSEISALPTVFRIPSEKPDKKLVALMMPFEKELDGVYKAVVAACEKLGLQCVRADNVWEASEIMQDVFSLIYRSHIVVCDFSGKNPNVFYETGIAHTLGRHVIPILQDDRDAPFDVRHHRFIKYLNNHEGLLELSEKIGRRLQTLLKA